MKTTMKKTTSKNQSIAFIGALCFSAALIGVGSAGALAEDSKYTAAKSQAEAVYDTDIKRCDTLAGNAKDVCVKDAKAKLTSSDADAKVMHKSAEAQGEANADKNAANYKAAKERCDSYSGDKKDACVDAAKAKYHQ